MRRVDDSSCGETVAAKLNGDHCGKSGARGEHNPRSSLAGRARYGVVATEQRGAKIKKRLAIDPVESEVLRLMFRLFRERDGKSGPMGVKAVTICPLCQTRALVPIFVLEWRKFGAAEGIRTS
jgi:hypothetical protein